MPQRILEKNTALKKSTNSQQERKYEWTIEGMSSCFIPVGASIGEVVSNITACEWNHAVRE